MMHFNEFRIFRGVRPNAFDGNHCIVEGSFIHIAKTSGGERMGIDGEKIRRKCV